MIIRATCFCGQFQRGESLGKTWFCGGRTVSPSPICHFAVGVHEGAESGWADESIIRDCKEKG